MPYPTALVAPMRAELTNIGVEELLDEIAVDSAMKRAESGTTLVVVNSVCGCAAGNARPAVYLARQLPVQPDNFVTVFAGQDLGATARMRAHLPGIPPSSPFVALIKDGRPVFVLERRHIEGRTANAIAMDLAGAFEAYCGDGIDEASTLDSPHKTEEPEDDNEGASSTFKSIL